MAAPVTSDPLQILLGHNHWATRRILDLCSRLTDAQFHQKFEIGPGSLHETLRHMLHNMRAWGDDVAGRPSRSMPGKVTVGEFEHLLDEATEDLHGLIERFRGRLDEHVHVKFRPDGPEFVFTRGVALVHVFVHGTHHRAQCLNMLRHLNVPGISDKLPDLDVNDWQHETECKI